MSSSPIVRSHSSFSFSLLPNFFEWHSKEILYAKVPGKRLASRMFNDEDHSHLSPIMPKKANGID